MEYRTLGRTGVKVTNYCLGCMMFGRPTSEADSMDIVDRAIDGGINFIDTADIYNRGLSEEAVGKALQRNGKRDQIVLATKVFGPMGEDPNEQGNHRRHIMEACEASLRRLQTDWIDLYYIHRPMPDIPIDETLRVLDDLIHAGKVRYIGTSSFAGWQVMESLWVAKELGLNRFVCEQPAYNLLDRRIERELVPCAQTYGLGIVPWSPLAGGFLTGKYKRGEPAPSDSRYSKSQGRGGEMGKEEAFDVVEVVEELAKEKGCTPSQLTLAWCAQQPGITSPIVGPRTRQHLEDNLGAADVEITEEDCQRLDEVALPGRVIAPYYGPPDTDFGPHKYRW